MMAGFREADLGTTSAVVEGPRLSRLAAVLRDRKYSWGVPYSKAHLLPFAVRCFVAEDNKNVPVSTTIGSEHKLRGFVLRGTPHNYQVVVTFVRFRQSILPCEIAMHALSLVLPNGFQADLSKVLWNLPRHRQCEPGLVLFDILPFFIAEQVDPFYVSAGGDCSYRLLVVIARTCSQLIRESTKQGSDKVARQIEAARRTALAKGEVGIKKKKAVPLLRDFLKNDFLPFAETKHCDKALTLRYYKQGATMLTKSSMAGLKLDDLTDQCAQAFAAHHSKLSPSGINRGLRTLRRALNLAYQWGKIDKPIKISLAKGEHQRDKVLTDEESTKYLSACPQPWRDCATIILDEGFRPGEVFSLRWPTSISVTTVQASFILFQVNRRRHGGCCQ